VKRKGERMKHAVPIQEEIWTKYLRDVFYELSKEIIIDDEQVSRTLNPVLEKIKGGKLERREPSLHI